MSGGPSTSTCSTTSSMSQYRPIRPRMRWPISSRRSSHVPSASSYGAYCTNADIVCLPGGRDRRVVGGLEVQLGEARRRDAARAVLERLLGVVHRHGDRHRRPVRPVVVGQRRPPRQARQPAVDLDHRAGRAPAVDPARERRRRSASPSSPAVDLRVGVGDDGPGADQLAALEHDALARADLGDGHAGRQHRAGLARRLGDGERDAAHAALDVAPRHRHALERALEVHQLDRRRAGVVRPGPRADDALAVERLLQPRVVDEPRR